MPSESRFPQPISNGRGRSTSTCSRWTPTTPSRLYFHCNGFIVALVDWALEAHGEPPPLHALPDNFYFATDDLDATLRRVTEAGGEKTSPIEVRPWGERSFYCADPDGHPLCFVDETTLFLGHGAGWA